MATKPKVKIEDAPEYRATLDKLYENATQRQLAQWALELADHTLAWAAAEYCSHPSVQAGYSVNRAWQTGEARMHDVRQAGFQIHSLAKACNDSLQRVALRVAGQAVGTGHMRQHAMVASDYAVKAINLAAPGNLAAVRAEREWQVEALRRVLEQ